MNKSLRALLAVIVLAFAAAGLYYAWFAPTVNKPMTEKLDVRKQFGAKVATDEGKPMEDVRSSNSSSPSAPVSVSASSLPTTTPTTAPTSAMGSTSTSIPSIPPGFAPDNSPMQPLPSNLPGFTPVTTSGAVVGVSASAQTSSATSQTSSATAPSAATIAPVPTSTSAGAKTPNATQTTSSTPSVAPSVTPSVAPSVAPSASAVSGAAPKSSAKSAPPSAAPAIIHVVAEGDNLSSIAKQYWGTSQGWENIVKANPGLTPTNLKIGSKLNIPAKEAAIANTPMPSIPSATTSGAGAVQNYEIVSGDSLSQISNKVYGDSKHWNAIYEANKKVIGEDPANLVVGTKLTIPAKPQSGANATPATKPVASPVVPRAPITTPAAKPATGSTSTGGAGGSSAPTSTPSTTAPIPTPPIPTPPVTTPGKPS